MLLDDGYNELEMNGVKAYVVVNEFTLSSQKIILDKLWNFVKIFSSQKFCEVLDQP